MHEHHLAGGNEASHKTHHWGYMAMVHHGPTMQSHSISFNTTGWWTIEPPSN